MTEATAADEIALESPLQDDVRALISELNATLLALTPPEFCSHMTAEEMAGPETSVWVARRDGVALGCGALRLIGGGFGEVKRMFVRPTAQGSGLGGRILDRMEAAARAQSLERLVLETGDRHPAAWRVYERAGFTRRSAFADYPDIPTSIFYEKLLTPAPPAATQGSDETDQI